MPESDENLGFDSRFSEFQTIIKEAKLRLEAAQDKNKATYDLDHTDEKFEIGDMVLIKNHTLSSREKKITAGLCPLYKDIGTISKVISDVTYEITFPDGSVKGPIHIQLLRRYHQRSESPLFNASSQPPTPQPTPPPSPLHSRQLRPRQPTDYRALHQGIRVKTTNSTSTS